MSSYRYMYRSVTQTMQQVRARVHSNTAGVVKDPVEATVMVMYAYIMSTCQCQQFVHMFKSVPCTGVTRHTSGIFITVPTLSEYLTSVPAPLRHTSPPATI